MTSYVDFSIWEKGADKPLNRYKQAACFAPLNHKFNELKGDSFVKFLVSKEYCGSDVVNWYVEGLNEIGLRCCLFIGEKFYNFRVKKQKSFQKMLAILTAIRYLQEYHYPEMINWAYNQFNKDKNLQFFDLFQLMHFSITSCCTNHAFHGGLSAYGSIYPLANPEQFKENLDKPLMVNRMFVVDKTKSLDKTLLEKIKDCVKKDNLVVPLGILRLDKKIVEV